VKVKLYDCDPKESRSRLYRLYPGDGLCDVNNTKEGCIDIAKRLEAIGIKTRVGQNCESGRWSVAILSVPDNTSTENVITLLPYINFGGSDNEMDRVY
jgi:hypothetical protein